MRSRPFLIEVFTAVTLSSVLLAASTEAGPIFLGLGDLDGGLYLSRANAVSADGTTVVGLSSSELGGQAFRWTAEAGMQGLGDLPGGAFQGEAFDVSGNGGVIIGSSESSGGFFPEGFRWESGVMTDLGTFQAGWTSSHPRGISRDGSTIVGGGGSPNGFEAFRWTTVNGFEGLGDFPGGEFESQANAVSSDGSVVAGLGQFNGGAEAFRWTPDSAMVGLGFLPGAEFRSSAAVGMTGDGRTIVGLSTSGSGTQGFRWTEEDGMSPLGPYLGLFTALAVSDDSSIIVGTVFADSIFFASIWDEVNGLRNLQDVLGLDFGLDLAGWTLEKASDISADGSVIVGTGINPFGQTEAWIAVIPEPTTLALLVAGAWLIPRRRIWFGG